MAGLAEKLVGRDAEATRTVQDALAPGALVDDTVRGAGVGEVDEPGNRQLHQRSHVP